MSAQHTPECPSRFALLVENALQQAGRAANGLPHGNLSAARHELNKAVADFDDLVRRASDVVEGLDPAGLGGAMPIRVEKLRAAIAKAGGGS